MADQEVQLESVDAGVLAPIVRQALDRDTVTVLDWRYVPLAHGVINPVTAGLYEFAGTAYDGQGQRPWSVILKALHWVDLSGTPLAEGYMNEPGDWNYWKREALVFQSGILDGWKGNLVPVRCYDVVEQADDSVWLWLEHVQNPPGTTWKLERLIVAARHFGEFNGAHCGEGRIPDYPWLCRSFLRQWVRTSRRWGLADIAADRALWERSHMRCAFPTPVGGRVIELLSDTDWLLAHLERQPQTLSHLDTHHVNLFARRGKRGQDQTVVIDWSFLGMAAVGEDLGMQIWGNLWDLSVDPTDARRYYEAALTAYVAGLRDAGWRGPAEIPRFGSATAASLRGVTFGFFILSRLTDNAEETPWAERLAVAQGISVEEVLQRWGQVINFLLDLADEARRLAAQI